MFRKENLIVNYFYQKTTADSQIADIPFMEGTTEESFFDDLHEWLVDFSMDWWSSDPEAAEEDEIYIEEIKEDGKTIILDKIKKSFFNYCYEYNGLEEDETYDTDREPDVDFNGGMEW